MKTMMIINILSTLAYGAGAVWGVVELVDYIVNQNSINWWFLLPLLGGILTLIFNIIRAILNS